MSISLMWNMWNVTFNSMTNIHFSEFSVPSFCLTFRHFFCYRNKMLKNKFEIFSSLCQKKNAMFFSLVILTSLLLVTFYIRERQPRRGYRSIDCSYHSPLSTIADIVGVADDDNCHFYNTLRTLYEIEEERNTIIIPGSFLTRVKKWLGDKEDLVEMANRQRVIQITNR